ncbi:hypothetical protein PR001_g34012 [Phytophthora rubi]|uniref:Reverse transcriptase Ty1/copia-type domain-containing protein n=1 Tax=Phytophthora rubi TaxID=129364 RepID=A0A6A3G278_9STRA|nr:hypothetical protein PR001_g34012 [Phytophthora rubi]
MASKTKWVYDTKTDSQGYVIRFKARLVALGNYQRPGIDFHESTLDEPTMTSANDDDTVAATVVNETMASITMDLEGGEACAAPSAVPTRTAQRHVELSEMRATT